MENNKLEEKIDIWKASLLDLSKRNRMINFRKTKSSTLKILEPDIFTLFDLLAIQDKQLTFKRPVDKDTDVQVYSMVSLLEALSFVLPVQLGDIKTDGTYLEYQRTIKNLRTKSRLALEEQGTNILYLSFGFIKWYSKEDKEYLTSPLILMPVTLVQDSISSPFKLKKTEDDIAVNPTLEYLFKSRDKIQLPAFDYKDKSSLSTYFEKIRIMCNDYNWEIIEECSLGLLSFLKISMYEDLENNRERIITHPVLRMICGEISAESQNSLTSGIDLDSISAKDFHCVLNTDSSQQKAVLLSKQGHSFILQGPPGTGKSQTIANIISEALADNKKILFVSEKLAALQVVLKRLTEVNLADFCLPLHNYKANKKEILESIGRNWDLVQEQVTNDAFFKLDELDKLRSDLNHYAESINITIEPFGETIYSVYGKLASLIDLPVKHVRFSNIGNISSTDFSQMKLSVRNYQKALYQLPENIYENPWYGAVVSHYEQEQKYFFISRTENLNNDVSALKAKISEYNTKISAKKEISYNKALRILAYLSNAIEVNDVPLSWFDKELVYKLISISENEGKRFADYIQRQATVDNMFSPDINKIDHVAWVSAVRESLDNLKKTTYYSRFDESVFLMNPEKINEKISASLDRIAQISQSYTRAIELLGVETEDTLYNMIWIGHIIRSLLSGLPDNCSYYSVEKRNKALSYLIEIRQHLDDLEKKQAKVSNHFTSEIKKINAKGMLQRFKYEYQGFTKFFKQSYRNDITRIKFCLLNDNKKISDEDIIRLLEDAAALEDEKQWFDTNRENHQTILGSSFQYTKTDCERIQTEISAAYNFSQQFIEGIIPEQIQNFITNKNKYASVSAELNDIQLFLHENYLISEFAKAQNIVEGFIDVKSLSVSKFILPELQKTLDDSIRLLKQMNIIDSVTKNKTILSNALYFVNYAHNTKSIRDDILSDTDRYKSFGQHYKGLDTDWKSINRMLKSVYSLISDSTNNSFSLEFCKAISTNEEVRNTVSRNINEINSKLPSIEEKINTFNSYFPELDLKQIDLDKLSSKYLLCLNNFEKLEYWRNYSESKNACNNIGLEDFTRIVEADKVRAQDIEKYFLHSFYIGWINENITKHPEIRTFHKAEHEQKIDEFRHLEDVQLGIAQKRIRESLVSKFPDKNYLFGEASILTKELRKKTRIKPLRKLFSEIPNVLLALKPCMMMSPLSVAYFLNNETFSNFDIVIFDEASQIFPQDAIGAICRGKQTIIAGDINQLPPTNFFVKSTSSSDSDYDSDDYYDEDISASILETASTYLPTKTLLWHYRSRDERLIAFSNNNIYNNELHTFPTNNEENNDYGLEYIFVEDGYYESGAKRRNVGEAKKCVELVRDHIIRHPERSLGIIAFSEAQQQTISDAINTFIVENPKYENFFDQEKEESFFVKNLESVQGDERDTIIFSICYAKTEEQKKNDRPMAMRFGPLANAGGERRLNVAVTRAKYNIKLVTSILPDDIDLSRTTSTGVRLLRRYMEYAMKAGHKWSGSSTQNIDEFADAIANELINNGYLVDKNVGFSKYRVDIAIKHPQKEVYVAGIECDGPMYYSSETAHDRDHLSHDMLALMGWNIYRIWSTEWNKNPENEIRLLRNFIDKSVMDYDSKKRANNDKDHSIDKEVDTFVEKVVPEEKSTRFSEFGFVPYKKTKSFSRESDISLIFSIIRNEQPIHSSLLIRRFNELSVSNFNIKKLNEIIIPQIRFGKLFRENEFLYMPDWENISVRIPGDYGEKRDIEYIYPGEIKLAMLKITEKSIGITKNDLFDILRKAFGFERSGQKILNSFNTAYEELLRNGKIIEMDGKIHTA